MKYLITLSCLIAFSKASYCQTDNAHHAIDSLYELKVDSVVRVISEHFKEAFKSVDIIYVKVDSLAHYLYGSDSLNRFLYNNLPWSWHHKPPKKPDKVVGQFVVEKDGSLTNFQIINGSKDLWKWSIPVLMKTSPWVPGVSNGMPVRTLVKQTLTFRSPG